MSELNEIVLVAFRDELRKTASRLTGAGALGGIGAGVGAAVGGLASGVSTYRDAREHGHGVGGSVLHGALGSLGGAGKGALVGAGVGAVAGAAKPGLGMAAAERFTNRDGALGSMARFGQRQVHGLTGHGDIRALRGGAYDAEKNLIEAGKSHSADVAKGVASPQSAGQLERAKATFDAASKAEEMGLSSAPGTVKSFARKTIETTKTLVQSQIAGATPGQKALLATGVGLGAYDVYNQASSDGEDKSKRVGTSVGRLAGNLALAPIMPLGASTLIGEGMGRAGGAAGRLSSRLKKRPVSTEISSGHGQHPADAPGAGNSPTEIIRTPSADDKPPADMVSA
jgi:hypothetical protein